jgi:hypothetical protein
VSEDDELELRLKALREELMRHVDAAKSDVENVRADIEHGFDKIDTRIKHLHFLIGFVVTVFGIVAAILANAANLF